MNWVIINYKYENRNGENLTTCANKTGIIVINSLIVCQLEWVSAIYQGSQAYLREVSPAGEFLLLGKKFASFSGN